MDTKQSTQDLNRHITTQDLSWFLDLDRNKQLNINPPYQRRSVWTLSDRQFFLDTIFRNYPSPAIFLHKAIDEGGQVVYHVVDGKQRIETILMFVSNKLKIAESFGNARLDGKKWKDIDKDLKHVFWDYVIPVEMIGNVEGTFVNNVFDRLNRNARKLERQELRHAQFDGWFIETAESEAERSEWQSYGLVTPARVRRMRDVQFISELLLVILERDLLDFDQNMLDEMYGKYDAPQDTVPGFDKEHFYEELTRVKNLVNEMLTLDPDLKALARILAHFYSLWSVLALADGSTLPEPRVLAERYKDFMSRVQSISSVEDPSSLVDGVDGRDIGGPWKYLASFSGAHTDRAQREARHQVLSAALLQVT